MARIKGPFVSREDVLRAHYFVNMRAARTLAYRNTWLRAAGRELEICATVAAMTAFAHIAPGRESRDPRAHVSRHRHNVAYAAVVLAGGYEECGSRGCFRVGTGDVLLHGPFDAHLDRFVPKATQILNLLLEPGEFPRIGVGRVNDADELARIAERDSASAGIHLREKVISVAYYGLDSPDMLAANLRCDPQCRLDAWARKHGLASETVSRGFRKVFGLSPAAFRAEPRAQGAFARIVTGRTPLSAIAAETGHADQAHMSRATKALTGRAPAEWRRSNSFKTATERAT